MSGFAEYEIKNLIAIEAIGESISLDGETHQDSPMFSLLIKVIVRELAEHDIIDWTPPQVSAVADIFKYAARLKNGGDSVQLAIEDAIYRLIDNQKREYSEKLEHIKYLLSRYSEAKIITTNAPVRSRVTAEKHVLTAEDVEFELDIINCYYSAIIDRVKKAIRSEYNHLMSV